MIESRSELLTTFYVGRDFYGIEVMKVQEVTGTPSIMAVPLAPRFLLGLINLRGQLATAVGLRELFGVHQGEALQQMSVVCRMDGNLVSLMVDSIGDVVEADIKNFEPCPDTIPGEVKRFIKGVYKMDGSLLSILDLDQLSSELSPAIDVNEIKNTQRETK